MQQFLNALKGQANIVSLLTLLILSALFLYRLKRFKAARGLLIFTGILFYLTATPWLPGALARQLEKQYPVLEIPAASKAGPTYIHLLGSGYSLDSSRPATARLPPTALARLAEAMRLYRSLDSSILVCSGGAPPGIETQAAVAAAAAILLGADRQRILQLDTPNTTEEEAAALAAARGNAIRLIVVTDAIHMPRAMRFFSARGFHPLAAPTNFKTHNTPTGGDFRFWPHTDQLSTTDRVLHEYLANIKAGL